MAVETPQGLQVRPPPGNGTSRVALCYSERWAGTKCKPTRTLALPRVLKRWGGIREEPPPTTSPQNTRRPRYKAESPELCSHRYVGWQAGQVRGRATGTAPARYARSSWEPNTMAAI